ncbi:hypothetical protein [Corynebacterium sp. 335C]
MSGRGAWWWVLACGAVLSLVSGAELILLDVDGAPGPVARDIRIVGWTSVVAGLLAAVLMDAARRSRRLRWILTVIVAFAAAMPLLGALAGATTPLTVLPPAILAVGMLLMFRAAAADAMEGE